MGREGIGWRDPKDFAILMGKILVALAGAILLTGLLRMILPYTVYPAGSPERILSVTVFYTTWMLLIFKFVFGQFIPLALFKGSGT